MLPEKAKENYTMASLNKVILIGNLGKDPEVRVTASGQTMANFSLATKESFKNKEGKREERTEWHNVVLWGRLAEIARDYLHKGKQVYIEGRLQTRKWEDKNGNVRYTTEIVTDAMQMLGNKGDGGHQSQQPEDLTGLPEFDDSEYPF